MKLLHWIVIALLLFACILGTDFENEEWAFRHSLAFPLDQLRALRLPLVGALLTLLFLASLTIGCVKEPSIIPVASALYFAFQLYFSMRLLAAGLVERAFLSVAVNFLTFATFGWLLPLRLRTGMHDVIWLVRANALALIIFALANCYQLAIDSSTVAWQGRLWGTAGHPQHAGTFLAIELVPLWFLMMRKEEPWFLRVIYAATAGCSMVLLVWTGSRSGMLMLLIGLAFLFRSNWKQSLWIVGPGIVLILPMLIAAPEVLESGERLVSTLDTRSDVWETLFEDFQNNPLLGTIPDDIDVGENSFMSAAARGGWVGIILLVATTVCTGAELLRLRHYREFLGSNVMLADMTTGVLVSLWIGAFFEGYLLRLFNFQIYALYIFLALLSYLVTSVAPQAGVQKLRSDRRDFARQLHG